MNVIASSKQLEWLLHDLTVRLGYDMAGRCPERFEALVARGLDAFADAVLIAEGLDPGTEKCQRTAVRAFVRRRFEHWASPDAI